MYRFHLICCFLLLSVFSLAQTTIIPGYTGYAVPSEEDSRNMFSEIKGLQNWKNTTQIISYYFHVKKTGTLSIKLNAKNYDPGNWVNLSIASKSFKVNIPASKSFKNIKVGSIVIKDTGFYTIQLSCAEKKTEVNIPASKSFKNIKVGSIVIKDTGFYTIQLSCAEKKTEVIIADIKSIELYGAPAEAIHTNTKPRRNAASVHLRYPFADTTKALSFYNEITIPEGADVIHSYYMACGFARGYFGIQVNSPTERRVIFSVWDAGEESIDRNKVADSNKVQIIAKGENVFADGFGNEGTGGHSHFIYNWKAGTTYKMLVTALLDSANNATIYTGYFYMPELQRWKLIASFKAPYDGKSLRNLYSFNENFVGVNGQLERKAMFGNQWIQNDNGRWIELTKSTFSYDATGKAGDRIDYGGGVNSNQFYLLNGGFKEANAKFGDEFNRTATNSRPSIDWFKNADSLALAQKEKALINEAIQSKKIDTTGIKNGVYYQILKEGSGAFVKLTDTVTLNYKLTLLVDGKIIEETKDKPATFPLSRLIKGWQIGVPLCKVGGKIKLIIPSALAYSMRSRSKDFPPNSILVFEIEVINTKS